MLQQKNDALLDGQLVEAIKLHNQDSFKILYCRYFKLLVRFAWYRVHSMETAKDLVQDVFFQIWMRRETLDPSKSIKAYLYRSLLNSIINHLKLHSTHTKSIEDINEDHLSHHNNPDNEFDLTKALNHLPEKLKTVYILNRIEGYKQREIAEICNISVKAVEKRMAQAFNLLRKFLTK